MNTIDNEFKPGKEEDYKSPPRLGGMIMGKVDVPSPIEGEFIFQTGERIFYAVRYNEIKGLLVRGF